MIAQGSTEWLALRAGKVTSSRVADVIAKGKGSAPSLTRMAYRDQLVAERLTGEPCEDGFVSEAMARGSAEEPYSRAAYEALTGYMVDEVAFVEHPRLRAGCSPDGLVKDHDGSLGGIEMKNPISKTHMGYVIADTVPAKYIPQMQWAMACTGRQWWDFVSYDARLPLPVRLFVKRLKRDDEWIKATEAEVEKFLAEVDGLVARFSL